MLHGRGRTHEDLRQIREDAGLRGVLRLPVLPVPMRRRLWQRSGKPNGRRRGSGAICRCWDTSRPKGWDMWVHKLETQRPSHLLFNYLEKALHNIETSSDIDYPVLTEVVWGICQVQSDQSLINCGSLMTRLRK